MAFGRQTSSIGHPPLVARIRQEPQCTIPKSRTGLGGGEELNVGWVDLYLIGA